MRTRCWLAACVCTRCGRSCQSRQASMFQSVHLALPGCCTTMRHRTFVLASHSRAAWPGGLDECLRPAAPQARAMAKALGSACALFAVREQNACERARSAETCTTGCAALSPCPEVTHEERLTYQVVARSRAQVYVRAYGSLLSIRHARRDARVLYTCDHARVLCACDHARAHMQVPSHSAIAR